MRRLLSAIGMLIALAGCAEQRAALLSATATPVATPASPPAVAPAPAPREGCAPVELAAAPDALVGQANDRASRGCWVEAEAAFAAARRAGPDNRELRDRHARMLTRLKRFDTAEAIYRDADAARPNDIGTLVGWGGVLLYADRPGDAAQRLQQALQLNKEQPRTWVMLGLANLMLDQRERAMAALAEAERLSPGSVDGLVTMTRFGGADILPRGRFPTMSVVEALQLGLARGRDGRARAMTAFEQMAAEPQPASFYFLWGMLHLLSDTVSAVEADRACVRFDQVLERDATHAWSHAACARALVQAGKLAPAIGRMDKALALAPGNPLMHAMYGEVLLLGRQGSAALTRLQDAERAFPDNPIISVYLAQALEATGDRAGAEAATRRAEEKLRRQ